MSNEGKQDMTGEDRRGESEEGEGLQQNADCLGPKESSMSSPSRCRQQSACV